MLALPGSDALQCALALTSITRKQYKVVGGRVKLQQTRAKMAAVLEFVSVRAAVLPTCVGELLLSLLREC